MFGLQRVGQKYGGRLLRSAMAALAIAGATVAVPHTASAQERYAAIVVDGKTGQILFSRNADAQRYPASLTKMMTLYLMFDALERGRYTLDSRLSVSANAAAQPPTKLGVRAGGTITVRDAILALVTKSANDVATVVAENLGGSVSAFATQMTATARGIGMSRTTFRNPHGLPNDQQVTTARDMALLGRALQDRFPTYYRFFSTRVFEWNGQRIGNHNNLLGRVEGVDGIKTGYIRASGYNLVTSVHRDNRYVVAVVMGGQTAGARDAHMRELIAAHLPRASTGNRTAPMLVAGVANTIDMMAPTPRPKPPVSTMMALAAVDPTAVAGIILEEFGEGDAEPTFTADAPPTQLMPTVMAAAGRSAGAAPGIAATPTSRDIAAAAPAGDGWKIQIGALPTASGAEETLGRARELLPQLLAGLSPYTEPVRSGNTTLYRARFAGFTDREAARAACAQLERREFACIALQ